MNYQMIYITQLHNHTVLTPKSYSFGVF